MDDRPSIEERYASAIRTGNLRSHERTRQSDSDVLGAAGFACLAGRPLAIALSRLFAGDDGGQHHIVGALSTMAWGKARQMRIKLLRVESDDMARSVLAWFRHRSCLSCGGHGFLVIAGELGSGRAVIGDEACSACHGTGKRPFDREFKPPQRPVASWLAAEIEREQSCAGPAIMASLAERL